MATFTEQILHHAPAWLKEGEGEKLLTVIGQVLDADLNWTAQGIHARFPVYGTEDVLALIGRDRLIIRGAFEDAETYAGRLIEWLDTWLYAGSPYAILRALTAYLAPYEVPMRIVNDRGSWYWLEDGEEQWLIEQGNWDWSSLSSNHPSPSWSRFWVILHPPPELWTRGPSIDDVELWDGAIDTPGFTIGTSAVPEHVASVRQIIRMFKDAKSRCEHIIVAFDDELFDPEDSAPPNPDGWWGNASRVLAGARVLTRSEDAEYWAGTGPHLEGL